MRRRLRGRSSQRERGASTKHKKFLSTKDTKAHEEFFEENFVFLRVLRGQYFFVRFVDGITATPTRARGPVFPRDNLISPLVRIRHGAVRGLRLLLSTL